MKKCKEIVFFDQNVTSKFIKKKHQEFSINLSKIIGGGKTFKQVLTPFSVLEFLGINLKKDLRILYENKPIEEYQITSFDEFENKILPFVKKEISRKLSKEVLKEKFKNKKNLEKKYNTDEGMRFLECCERKAIEKESHKEMINSLVIDRVSCLHISKNSEKDLRLFIKFFLKNIIIIFSNSNQYCTFRVLNKCGKLSQRAIKSKEKNEKDKFLKRFMKSISTKDKLYGDLLDLEMIHVACFGKRIGEDFIKVNCYTLDKKEDVEKRLESYILTWRIVFPNSYLDEVNEFLKEQKIEEFYKRIPNPNPSEIIILEKESGKEKDRICVKNFFHRTLNNSK